MPAKQSLRTQSGKKQTDPAGRYSSLLNRPALLGWLSFFFLALLFTALIYQRYLILKEAQQKEEYEVARTATDKLQQSLAFSLSATKILSFFVDHNGQVNNFDSVAKQIMASGSEVDALQLVPEGVIRYVYPLKGNEKVIGYDILKDPARNKEAYKAIDKRQLYFAGPFELRQGGIGVVGRLPVFRNNKFWGFSAVVIKMPTLLRAAGIDSTGESGYYFQLSKLNPDTRKEEYFIQQMKDVSGEQSVSISVPNGEWKLSVSKITSFRDYTDIFLFIVFGSLFSILGGLFIFHVARRPGKLDELVRIRTRQLRESEEKFSKAFHSNLLGLIIYDRDWNIVDVNDPYAALLEATPDSLIGKHSDVAGLVSKVDPYKRDFISKEIEQLLNAAGFLENYEISVKTKDGEEHSILLSIEPVELDSKPHWVVSAIDISANKKAELKMKRSEEKYRNLVEQASDGIVITDLDGHIIEVNNSMCLMGGYPEDEMLGKHLYEFLPEDDTDSNPLRINELMQGKALLYERRLLKKNGSVLDIEVNSRMASSHTLIGFIRDISERKKYERELEYKSRLLESVSDAITSLDMDRCIVSWNKACEELYGFTSEEILGRKIPELVTFEYPGTSNEEVFKEVFSKGRWRGEFNFLHPRTNKTVQLLSSVNLLRSKNGDPNGFIITSRDITEQKEAQQLIAENEERYRTLVEQASDGIFIADKTERFIMVNPAGCNMSQYSQEELLEKTIYDFVLPEDLEKNPFHFADMANGNTARVERRMKRKDESFLEVEVTAKFISGERFLAFVRDISEKKKAAEEISISNERFGIIAQATNDAVWDHNFEKNETWGNKKLYSLYGFDSEDTKINFEMFLERIHPDERDGIVKRLNQAIDRKENVISEEFHFKMVSGEYRTFYDRAYIKYGDNGKPQRILGAMQDITDREQTEKQILKEKELSDSIINSLPGVFYLYTRNGKSLRWNKNFELVSGYTAEEIGQMPPIDFFDEDEKGLLTEKIKNVFKNGYDSVEANFLLKNREKIPYYFTGQSIQYQGEQCLMGVGFDVSEKQKAEKAIRESEERNRALVEHAPEALVVFDVNDKKFTSVSTSATKLFKMSQDELLKIGPVEVSPEFQPDGRTSVEAAAENIQKVIDGEKPVFEWMHRDSEGNDIPCEVWLVRLPAEGKILIRGSILDITARKKAEEKLMLSEQKYRLLFYNNPLPMWMVTIPDLMIIDVNDAAINQYGYSREEFLKLSTKDLRPAEDLDNFLKEVRTMKPDTINVRSWRHKKKDGTVINVETYSHQIMYEGRKVWLGLSHDVTEEYKAKELLQKSYEDIRLLASNLQSIREDERTNIAREIHDELGQQLTGLKMDMHWLNKKINNTDQEVDQKMKESIELINTTIATVRKIATDLRPSILDDLGLLAALEWQSEEFERRSGTKVFFANKTGDLLLSPKASTALFRIYQEVLTNIARHANATQVEALLDSDDKNVYFSIKDNGVGFDVNSTKGKKTLGLLGIKERTLLIGGTYDISSMPGHGSEIRISIPLDLSKPFE